MSHTKFTKTSVDIVNNALVEAWHFTKHFDKKVCVMYSLIEGYISFSALRDVIKSSNLVVFGDYIKHKIMKNCKQHFHSYIRNGNKNEKHYSNWDIDLLNKTHNDN